MKCPSCGGWQFYTVAEGRVVLKCMACKKIMTEAEKEQELMCYSRCPSENSYTGECSSPRKNSLSPSAHCHEREEVEEELEESQKRVKPRGNGAKPEAISNFNRRNNVTEI